MYTQQPKKLIIINILDILKRYSDPMHRLSQKDIVELLESKYEMKADRKAVKRNLLNLLAVGYNIGYTESVRKNSHGKEETVYTDWYFEWDFSDSELRLLIDNLLFSKNIPYNHCKELIKKIEGLSNQYFSPKVRHICNLPADQPNNPELFLTIEILDEAIEKGCRVEFNYADYDIDKQLHERLTDTGEPRLYKVSPYQMVASNGRYYLICNHDTYENITHYRIDRMSNIRLTEKPIKPAEKLKDCVNGLNLPRHMAEHVYMFSGESARITMRTTRNMAGDLIDWFGNGVTFKEEDADTILAFVTANISAIRFWALQYAPYVTVLEPKSLVDTVKKDLEGAINKYMEGN